MSMEEDAQQRITYLLQEIDANICAAHRSATQICGTVRRHHQILRQIHETSQLWRPLFDSFTQQPSAATRRLTRTPGRFSRSTPGPRAVSQGGEQQIREAEAGEEEEEEEVSIVGSEQTFKTTKLKKHQPPTNEQRDNDEDSLNFSINSDNLPRMSRTPYLSKSAGRKDGGATHESSSTLNSQDRSDWSPTITSPPRTGIITDNSRHQPRTSNAGTRQISTPPSAISSVAYNSPGGVSKNLMKVGAFEYTPPRGSKGRSTEPEDADDSNDSIVTPPIPRFSTVPTPHSIQRESVARAETSGGSASRAAAARTSEGGGSGRKRKLSDGNEKRRTPEKRHTPSYPKTHHPGSPSPAFSSPSLRRKFSTGGYSTPSSHRKSQARSTPVKATPTRQSGAGFDEDSGTPEFDLASPLLRTQLKAMSPHTPLSNRLVGANLDVGSISQEAKLQDYDDSFNSGEPAPKFELALFPAAFQRGAGAVQISTLYSKFQGADDSSKPAISVDQLAEMLPDYGTEKLEILLDTLVSRRLLRPFVVEGTMFWQQPV